MVTGAVSEEFAARIIKQGADDYILKDRMSRLPAAIRTALLQKRALKEITDYKYALDMSAIVAITDQKGIILYANENFCRISKYSLDELIGQDHRIVNSGFHPAGYIKDLWVNISNGKSWTGEFCNRAKDNTTYWVDTHIVPFLNDLGKPYQYLAITQDITKRKKAEDELRLSEIRLNEAQAIAHIANWEIDLVKNIHTWSDELYRIFDLKKGEVQPSTELFLAFIHSDDAGEAEKLLTEALALFTESKIDFRFKLPNGKKRYGHIEWRFDFDTSGKPFRIFGILQDITDRREAEESVTILESKMLAQKAQEQKKIFRAVLKGQEKERNFISRELHDNVNQILAGAKLYLGGAGKKDERVKELVKYPMELLDLSIEEIRQLCQKLVPPQNSIDFREQIQDLLYKLGESTGVATSLTYAIADDLISHDLQLNIYRIIQELLNNVSKYAEAKSIEVVIIATSGFISVTVTDDGKGFNKKIKRHGIGISNIIYRAECFSGKVSIKSSPGKGCKVYIRIPY
jgi:PAS domain S-box-containing protein